MHCEIEGFTKTGWSTADYEINNSFKSVRTELIKSHWD